MKFDVRLQSVPIGITMNAARPGEQVEVLPMEFVSAEDGDTLINRLEQLGNILLSAIGNSVLVTPSKVSSMLAIIRRDATATIYLNDLTTIGAAQVKRDVKKGDALYTSDIVDLHSISFEGVSIPEDVGVVYIFSVGWRRAMFYDLWPLHPGEGSQRTYDVGRYLGAIHTYLLFQDRFKIPETAWAALFANQWFPFIGLSDDLLKGMLARANNALDIDELLPGIAVEMESLIPRTVQKWRASPLFVGHLPVIERAAELYSQGDYLGATALMFPRLEGLMRSHQGQVDPSVRASQSTLSESAVRHAREHRHEFTPLLPIKFQEYLKSVYFASFDPKQSNIGVSRNSVAHGVAAASALNQKSAIISFLLADQLFYCFQVLNPPSEPVSGVP